MSSRPLVSVIMNCYNGEKYLREAIDSVLAQTYENWELIFWDNQSADDSASVINSYNDDRIRYFYAKNHTNLGDARNLALMKANGEWVGFLDVDDLWFPEKLKKQLEEIANVGEDVGLSYSRCELFRDIVNSGKVSRSIKVYPGSKSLPQENLANELFMGNLVSFTSVLYKKTALDSLGGIPSYKHPPDYYISLAIALDWKVSVVDEVLCAYRLHHGNLSLEIKEDGYRESLDIVRKLSPPMEIKKLERNNLSRLIIFLTVRFRWNDAIKELLKMGLLSFIIGLIGLLRFKLKYSCSPFDKFYAGKR